MSGDGGRRKLTDDERVLWTTFTKAIEPISRTKKIESAAPPLVPAAESVKPRAAKPVAQPAPRKAEPPPRKPEPALAPLGRRMKQRVARGKESIDGRLDLHGLTQEKAHEALGRFLHSASLRQAKLVLVITGKGRGGEPGVLRRQVPLWLKLPEFRDLVIGFETAAIGHGGEGALYVRVRRTRGTPEY
ncbi:MAG: Smr/MutS family protein [Hyphomicrobiales bacterium]